MTSATSGKKCPLHLFLILIIIDYIFDASLQKSPRNNRYAYTINSGNLLQMLVNIRCHADTYFNLIFRADQNDIRRSFAIFFLRHFIYPN